MPKRLLFVLVVLTLALTQIAATGAETATQIATAILIAAPLVLPLVLKYVPLDGTKMTVLTYAISVVVAIVAGIASGMLKSGDLSSAPGLLAAGTAVFGLSQLVFGILKNSGKFVALVK
jgi:hypothetical protein